MSDMIFWTAVTAITLLSMLVIYLLGRKHRVTLMPKYLPDHYQKFLAILLSGIGFAAIMHMMYKVFGVWVDNIEATSSIMKTAMLDAMIVTVIPLILVLGHKMLKTIMVSKEGLKGTFKDDDTQDVLRNGDGDK